MDNRKRKTLLINKLAPILAETFGYFSLLYTIDSEELVENNILIRNQITLVDDSKILDEHQERNNMMLKCKFEELPIASDSIDLILLPEVLQKSEFPHQVLREAERVLIPDGTIVLIINNPFGFTSLKKEFKNILLKLSRLFNTKLFKKTKDSVSENTNQVWFNLGTRRIRDWLNLLGIETIEQIAVYDDQQLKIKGTSNLLILKNKIKNILYKTFADQIIIVGKKNVSTLTPIRASWRRNKRFVRPRFAEPSVQQQAEFCLTQITK